MHDESLFLEKITAQPEDDALRHVYADWLEERDEPRTRVRAAFLRAQLQGRRLPGRGKLAKGWLAQVDKPEIENCRFSFECPRRWQDLQTTDNKSVRFCGACQEKVHFCATVPEAREHAMQGHCVAVSSLEPRQPRDLYARMRMGRMMRPR